MRGKPAPKRVTTPDAKYHNVTVSKFINKLMYGGKKSVAEGVVYDAFALIEKRTKKDPLEVFEQAIQMISPSLEVKSRRVGGSNYQIPIEVRGDRKIALAMRWILEASRKKKGKAMSECLAEEIVAATEKQGDAWKKREDVHRMADANRAFAHFA
ncbi:MAG: 30S ribosomal protein S7 [Patescibacteria group bacterium]|jgi:small subunit ribosomal protein S7